MSGLDELDRRLLDLLVEDARLPLTGLAKRLGVARSTVQIRLARLEARGVIGGYTLRPGPALVAAEGVAALVSLVVDPRLVDRVVGSLDRLGEVRRVHAVAGSVDLVVWVRCETPAALDRLLDTIGAVTGVVRTTSSVVLATPIDREVGTLLDHEGDPARAVRTGRPAAVRRGGDPASSEGRGAGGGARGRAERS